MKEQKVGDDSGQNRLTGVGPASINALDCYLKTRGYRHSTRRAYLASMEHFCYWLKTRRYGDREINSNVVGIFLQEHLPVCHCPRPVQKGIKTVRAALNQFLLMRGQARVRRRVSHGTSTEIEGVIDRFDEYLQNVCGHSEATRWYHRRNAKAFLSWHFGDRPLNVARITAQSLCRFVTAKAGDYCPGSIGVLVYSLRTYMKFLQFTGHVTPSLAATIPRPPNWSAASLPRALNSKELSLFWSVFERSTPIGKRDYAMARCLADLGLRCYEVANIHLHDIDWRSGVLRLSRTKSRREETLPIPGTMGQAIVSYLRYGRPHTNSRAVFVHHRGPVGKAVRDSTVRGAVRRAFSRAGLAFSGTHILRNTFASRLLEGGATLKEIADLLRHGSIDTTKSYVKIDLQKLAHVAMPWPGRLS